MSLDADCGRMTGHRK